MNIKECLLLVLIPLGVLPVCLCLIVFSLFPSHQLIVPISVSIVIVLVSTLVAIGIAHFFRGIFQQIYQAIHRIDQGDLESEIDVSSTLRDVNRLGVAMEQMRLKLVKNQDFEVREKTLQAIEQTATHVAHDIRSPLSSMKAATRLLVKTAGHDASAKDALNLLQLSSTRLENIANDLLRKHRGDLPTSNTFSIHEVIDELVGEFQASPLGYGVKFEKNYHYAALYVTGNKSGIGRAIGNIIKNALEAMQGNASSGESVLTVSTALNSPSPGLRPTSPTGGEVDHVIVIKVTDTGPGITEEKIALIMQGGHTEGKKDGHGIGTMIAQEMIALHKGSVAIESRIGEGTTFIMTLPSTQLIETPVSDTVISIPYSGEGPIFVIDDDAGLREQWRLTLLAQDIEARVFERWEEWEQQRPLTPALSHEGRGGMKDTFIIDYHFENSEVDGLEIIRRLKSRGYTQFVLATAEYWKPMIKEASQELGIIVCPKPLPTVVVQRDLPLPTSPYKGEELEQGYTVLVLDDDLGIQETWKVMQRSWGVQALHTYATMEECQNSAIDLSTIDVAFVDKNIPGSAWTTDAVIAHLRTCGVGKVWIASGNTLQDIRNDAACADADGILDGKLPSSIAACARKSTPRRKNYDDTIN